MNTELQQLIAQHLPQDLWETAKKFEIAAEYIPNMPDLIELVLRSKSLEKDEEKQSRFNLLPLMNDEQINKLKDILIREKQKLEEIEKKYEDKKVEIKKKYLLKWQSMGYVQKVTELKAQEQTHTDQEHTEADQLLANL